ncbi:MAG: GTP-binding protein [Anaerolineaceae bacterium]|jgi:bifunctional enzyme CysN/CysC
MTVQTAISTSIKMNIVVAGHVDHGKSTVIGRLLADTGSLPEGKLEQVRASCERNSRPFEYAFLIDALKDEQAQNITIDAARVFFKSSRRHYIIIDAPGHIEFIKNMVTGASHAEAALLVIDAVEGVQENSRRHGYLLWMLGIQQVAVLINKMDVVGYDQEVYQAVKQEYAAFLRQIGLRPAYYIPVSGREGDLICQPSEHMPWYNGPDVLAALDSFHKAPPPVDEPLRMPVQDIYKFTLFGDNRRIVAGTIANGSLQIGDEIVFYPSGKRSVVKTFERFAAPEKKTAQAGEAIGFTLAEQIYIQRGEIAARANEPPPKVTQRLRASLFWLGRQPMLPKKQYLLKLGTARVKVQLERINRVIDASDYANSTGKQQIDHHDVAEVILHTQRPIAFDLSETLCDTSRFVIVDEYEICGGGIVLEDLADEQTWLRENVLRRESKWVRSDLTSEDRADRYNQKPALVIITGEKGVGRKRIARMLEQRLFRDGKIVYYLGMGSVLYGVDADLQSQQSGQNRPEHIRRLAEISHIFLDAGLILIVTAVELTQQDLKIMQAVIDATQIETIWVGDRVTTDINFDTRVQDGELAENSVIQIKRLLQDHGIIFSP